MYDVEQLVPLLGLDGPVGRAISSSALVKAVTQQQALSYQTRRCIVTTQTLRQASEHFLHPAWSALLPDTVPIFTTTSSLVHTTCHLTHIHTTMPP